MPNRPWSILLIAMTVIISAALFTLFFNQKNDAHNPIQALLQKHQATLRANNSSIETQWLKTLNPLVKNTEGQLVWNTEKQQGVMTFINLPQPKVNEYYHLWIYDLKRSQQDPISGGAFIPAKKKNTEHWVAITPQDKVVQPYKFIIFLESKNVNVANTPANEPQILLLAQP